MPGTSRFWGRRIARACGRPVEHAVVSRLDSRGRRGENTGMLRLVITALCSALTAVSLRAETDQMDAYAALLLAGREKSDALLNSLVEMRGIDGEPQPRRWTLSFRDETARGGIRELIVSPKGIIGERTPLRPAAQGGAVMAAAGLKLNSTGAFEAANREATRARIGFHSINYRLDSRHGTPTWLVQLFEVGGSQVGQMELSATDGTVVSALRAPAPGGADAAPVSPVAPTSSLPVESEVTPLPPATSLAPAPNPATTPAAATGPDGRTLGERWVEGGGLVGHMERFGEKTWDGTTNTASRIGDSLGAFFMGRPPGDAAPGN